MNLKVNACINKIEGYIIIATIRDLSVSCQILCCSFTPQKCCHLSQMIAMWHIMIATIRKQKRNQLQTTLAMNTANNICHH